MGVSNLMSQRIQNDEDRVPASNASTFASEVIQENHSDIESGRFQNNTKEHKNAGEAFDSESDILFLCLYLSILLNHFC